MSLEENKKIARQFMGILQSGEVGPADEIVAPTYVNNNPIPGQAPGLEGFKAFVAALHKAISDLQMTIEDEVAEGDKVALRYSVSGTHQGPFLGAASTGKPLAQSAHRMQRIADGQVQEIWLQWDSLGVMQQLRVISMPPPSRD